ncbi:PHD-like zinc-binding domain-containing protein [Mycena olivaceomarginata]|nr:PHD-like zinc-binding domain-containing protein [Mycena olivaceomarginata]
MFFMEPVIGIENISKQRRKLKCSICTRREGACIQCVKQSCFLAFHVTCARKSKLLFPMRSTQGSELRALACFCERHLLVLAETPEAAVKNGAEPYNYAGPWKSARDCSKSYQPQKGPPLVPAIIVNSTLQYIGRTNIREMHDFVILTCKYWSLKREARGGAPLLMRIQL